MNVKVAALMSYLISTYINAELIEPPMVLIPPGEFFMGSNKGKENEKPIHSVSIDAFYAGKYEVTVREFRQFINATGFKRTDPGGDACWNWDSKEYIKPSKGNWDNAFNAPSDFHPVMCITVDQAKAYIEWLKDETGKPYRLLTESEWEYAARANSKGKYFFGESPDNLCEYGNVFDITGKAALEKDHQLAGNFKYANCDDHSAYTSVVGMYQPNSFGLYDTIGNVGEIVMDCEHDNYQGAPTDGSAWVGDCALFRGEHVMQVTRGAGYGLMASPMRVRSANREHFGIGNGEGSSIGVGFRIALDFKAKEHRSISSATAKFEKQLAEAKAEEHKLRTSYSPHQ